MNNSIQNENAQCWQPVQGSFTRNFHSEFAPATPKAPAVNAAHIKLPTTLERMIAEISQRHIASGIATNECLEQVRRICVSEGAPDYSKHASAFFNLYFEKNVRKVANVISTEEQLCLANSIRILDIGAGSGASTLGAVSALLGRATPPKHIFIDLLDRSLEQLALAQEVLTACYAATSIPVSFRIIQADAIDVVRSINQRLHSSEPATPEDQYDLVLSSYFVTELSSEAAATLAVELQCLMMNTKFPAPALLFMGSYLPGNHFGYYLYNPQQGDPDLVAIDLILKAVGMQDGEL